MVWEMVDGGGGDLSFSVVTGVEREHNSCQEKKKGGLLQ